MTLQPERCICSSWWWNLGLPQSRAGESSPLSLDHSAQDRQGLPGQAGYCWSEAWQQAKLTGLWVQAPEVPWLRSVGHRMRGLAS